jgi:hypothetical protein
MIMLILDTHVPMRICEGLSPTVFAARRQSDSIIRIIIGQAVIEVVVEHYDYYRVKRA